MTNLTPATIEELKERLDWLFTHKPGSYVVRKDVVEKELNWIMAVIPTTTEAVKSGFYAGQAMAGVELEDCHTNWKKWNTPDARESKEVEGSTDE